ncbi:MAG: four helix bundle protein [bacterium]|nr:four helix bundle protein [bacterium]MDZ4285642.1 four helix bundle protein [Candidatus Sungbacteria bacterium]
MTEIQNSKHYDLEERTYQFAGQCRDFIKQLPRNISNVEYGKQLVRSSGSVAANYIEANESLSKKDFFHRVKICRKEVKESCLWLRLCEGNEYPAVLINEATELMKIFGAIIEKSK